MIKSMSQKGFTLVEMLVVIAIIAILASIFLVGLQGFRGSAYDARRLSDTTNIQSQLELYYNQHGNYPADLTALSSLPTDPTYAGTDKRTGYYYCVSSNTQSYIVGALLSAANSATKNSVHDLAACDGNGPKIDGTASTGQLTTLDCAATSANQYCVGPGSSN